MDSVYIWFGYRCWSKILWSTIRTPAYDLEVKVMDLEIFLPFPYEEIFMPLPYEEWWKGHIVLPVSVRIWR